LHFGAARLGRRYIGYDLDPAYVEIARTRVLNESAPPETSPETLDGKTAQKLAEEIVAAAGFTITHVNQRIAKTGTRVSIVAADADGAPWFFDVTGAFTTYRGGLIRTENVWKTLGRAHALRGRIAHDTPVVFLTTDLPRARSEGDVALRAAGPDAFFDAIELRSDDGRARLERYANGGHTKRPLAGFWSDADLAR